MTRDERLNQVLKARKSLASDMQSAIDSAALLRNIAREALTSEPALYKADIRYILELEQMAGVMERLSHSLLEVCNDV